MSFVRRNASQFDVGRIHRGSGVILLVLALASCGTFTHARATEIAIPPPAEIVRRADQQRGLGAAHAFIARIQRESSAGTLGGRDDVMAAPTMLVEVWSNGFQQQLVFVLEPHRGDVMLATPDVVWIRPRRLHRLTRVPPDLRMFNGASVADVTSVDVVGTYAASLAPADDASDAYELDLVARREHVRYPRARYKVRCADFRPLEIEFMTVSGKVLKSVRYERFTMVLGRTMPTELIVSDLVYHDVTVVMLSDFRPLLDVNATMFTPDYLLSIPGAPS
jgi:hypothetical protein